MSVESVIRAGRRFAESRMTSACTITRVTGRTLNESTGEYAETVATVYTGACKVVLDSPRVFNRDVESQLLSEQLPILLLPIGAGSDAVTVNDVATITGSPMDPGLVGARIRVAGKPVRSYATARRFAGEVLT
jgi:hypothetical protein